MTTATCPDAGTLRAHLDGEAEPSIGTHVGGCARCEAELSRLRADAALAAGAMALLAPPEHLDVAPTSGPGQDRQPSDLDERRRRRSSRLGRGVPLRRVAAAAAVAVATVAMLGTPAGREAAASFLSQFRGERIQVVSIDPYGAMNQLAMLEALGTVESDMDAGMVFHVDSVETARQRTGLPVPAVAGNVLPESFAGMPSQVLVTDAGEVRISFERVGAWLEQHGSDLEPPAGIEETRLVVQLPAAVAQVYRGPSFEEIVVGESGLVTADAHGPVSLEELRDFLLELPGLPPAVVEQLRAIDDWRSTLPLPVPAGQVDSRDTTIGGAPAVALRGSSGIGHAILWQRDGLVHGVGGLVDERTVRRIAESLAR